MPESYVIKDQFATYFLTFQIVGWLDIFTRKRYRDIVVDSFNYCVEQK
jgi:putative transposase